MDEWISVCNAVRRNNQKIVNEAQKKETQCKKEISCKATCSNVGIDIILVIYQW